MTVLPDVFEVGGIYSKKSGEENVKSRTAQDLAAAFPNFNVELLPPEGPWYVSGQREAAEAAHARAAAVVSRLLSPSFCQQHEDETLVMVSHQDFLDLMLRRLVGSSSEGFSRLGPRLVFNISNTATSMITIGHSSAADEPAACGTARIEWIARDEHLRKGDAFGGPTSTL